MADDLAASQSPLPRQADGAKRRNPQSSRLAAFFAIVFAALCSFATSGGGSQQGLDRRFALADEWEILLDSDLRGQSKKLEDWTDHELSRSIRANKQVVLEQARREAWATPGNYHLRRAVAFPRDLIVRGLYALASHTIIIEQAKVEEGDYRAVAMYEAEQECDSRAPTQLKLAGAVFGVPSYLALALAGWLIVSGRRPRPADPVRRFVTFVSEAVTMLPRRKKVIWAGLVCLGLLTLIVPWAHRDGSAAGYSLIFLPPDRSSKIDLPRFLIPAGFVVCATIAGFFLARPNPQRQS